MLQEQHHLQGEDHQLITSLSDPIFVVLQELFVSSLNVQGPQPTKLEPSDSSANLMSEKPDKIPVGLDFPPLAQ